jgi:hypothetical protein
VAGGDLFLEVTDPDGIIGTHPAVTLTDGVTETVYYQISLPTDFVTLTDAIIIVVPGGTGNLRFSIDTNWAESCAGEDYNINVDAIAANDLAVTINELECININAALTGIAAGDVVGINFTRYGGHANDTVDADVYYLGARLTYP